jgi:hypothetical protein
MKLRHIALAAQLACMGGFATADEPSSAPAEILLNQNIGFNVEGFKYEQAQYPCDIDEVLVDSLVKRSKRVGLNMKTVSTAKEIQNATLPLLALDIDSLVLGNKKHNYGTRTSKILPSVTVTAALVDKRLPGGSITAKHSCSIASLRSFTHSTDVMDMGTYGVTVCTATRKCVYDLSKDIIKWVGESVQ